MRRLYPVTIHCTHFTACIIQSGFFLSCIRTLSLFLCILFFDIPGEGHRALRLLALVRERQGLALVPGVADVAHILRGMSWGTSVDTNHYGVADSDNIRIRDTENSHTNKNNNIDSSDSVSTSSAADNNCTTASHSVDVSILWGHLDVVLDLIVQQSLQEKQKREKQKRSSPLSNQPQRNQWIVSKHFIVFVAITTTASFGIDHDILWGNRLRWS